jgi:hypothetical protein
VQVFIFRSGGVHVDVALVYEPTLFHRFVQPASKSPTNLFFSYIVKRRVLKTKQILDLWNAVASALFCRHQELKTCDGAFQSRAYALFGLIVS